MRGSASFSFERSPQSRVAASRWRMRRGIGWPGIVYNDSCFVSVKKFSAGNCENTLQEGQEQVMMGMDLLQVFEYGVSFSVQFANGLQNVYIGFSRCLTPSHLTDVRRSSTIS